MISWIVRMVNLEDAVDDDAGVALAFGQRADADND